MEKTRVGNRVETLRHVCKREDILDKKSGVQSALSGLLFGPLDWDFEEIDARDLVSAAGEEKCQLTRAAADVQNLALDLI